MSVYLLTKPDQLKVCRELAAHMERTCRDVLIFTDCADFFSMINIASPGEVEYVMIDIRTYQTDLFNPYEYMARCRNPVPVVVYNDPFPEPKNRAAYWYYKNKIYLESYVGREKLDLLQPAFSLIEIFFDEHQFSKYLSAISFPENLYSVEEKSRRNLVENFTFNHKLSDSRKKLFDYFIENLNVEIPEEKICLDLWNEYSDKSRKILYSYISQIRKACNEESSLCISIVKSAKGIYKMSMVP